jgi:MFS family permease
MALAGVGAGINELTALAATSELAPTAKRGKYVAVLIFTIIPFCPSVLWGQLIAYHSSWRYVGLICGVWAFIGLVMTAIFYFPPPRVNSLGLTNKEIIAQIDFVGGFLSIVVSSGEATNTHGNPPTLLSPSSSAPHFLSVSVSGKSMERNIPCSPPVSGKIPAF